MNPKRNHPAFSLSELHLHSLELIVDEPIEDFQSLRKQIKTDSTHLISDIQDDHELPHSLDLTENHFENNELFEQQFYNLRACSFKTISKMGLEKISSCNKNQVAQLDVNFSSSNRKRKNSLNHMSEQKIKNIDYMSNNRGPSSLGVINFDSMNEIKYEKKYCVERGSFNQVKEKNQRREPSFPSIPFCPLNTINTQVLNQMMDLDLKNKNEISEEELNQMIQMALIKNVKFTANLFLKFNSRKPYQKYFPSLPLYKLIDIDGFSITGFYSQEEKMRINLIIPITNKEFQQKFVLQAHPHPNIQKSKQCFLKEKGVEFTGSYLNNERNEWEDVKFYLSEIKDGHRAYFMKKQHSENTNSDNCSFIHDGVEKMTFFGTFGAENHKKLAQERI